MGCTWLLGFALLICYKIGVLSIFRFGFSQTFRFKIPQKNKVTTFAKVLLWSHVGFQDPIICMSALPASPLPAPWPSLLLPVLLPPWPNRISPEVEMHQISWEEDMTLCLFAKHSWHFLFQWNQVFLFRLFFEGSLLWFQIRWSAPLTVCNVQFSTSFEIKVKSQQNCSMKILLLCGNSAPSFWNKSSHIFQRTKTYKETCMMDQWCMAFFVVWSPWRLQPHDLLASQA